MLQKIATFFSASWYWILIFFAMTAISFFLLQCQVKMRDHMSAVVEDLLRRNPGLCLERLNNNWRLKLLFRKPLLELWKLDACMALGNGEGARKVISGLRAMKLEPRDKLELYQKELSFYASCAESDRARKVRDELKAFLKKMGVDQEKAYASILDEADIIIGVYVDHDIGLIKKLVDQAEHTKNDIMRGITQYRIAKLAWFKGNTEMMQTYLSRAGKNLQGTWYAPIIEEAKTNPAILETK